VRQTLELTTLGAIARIDGKGYPGQLIVLRHPRSPVAEAYRVLRTNLQFSAIDRPLRTLMVTSASPVEGKSVTAANLAAVMAQAGKRVILVDADLRCPVQHRIFELNNNEGLTTALVQGNVDPTELLCACPIGNLSILPSGPLPPNPAELLGSQRMGDLIEALQKRADVVIFDCPPVMAVADAAILAARLDGTLLVVDSGKTRRPIAQRVKGTLESVGARLLGVVLNRLSTRSSGYYYYYYSGDGQRRQRSGRNPLARLFGRDGGSAGRADVVSIEPEEHVGTARKS